MFAFVGWFIVLMVKLLGKGFDASLLLVDGNPLQDITATERISRVFFKGESVPRADLFDPNELK